VANCSKQAIFLGMHSSRRIVVMVVVSAAMKKPVHDIEQEFVVWRMRVVGCRSIGLVKAYGNINFEWSLGACLKCNDVGGGLQIVPRGVKLNHGLVVNDRDAYPSRRSWEVRKNCAYFGA
jgi:hypothetical protein